MKIFRSRRRSLFGLLAMAAAATAVLAPIATGSHRASAPARMAGSKGTIAIMFPNASQPIVVDVLNVAKQEAKKRGYTFLISDPGNDVNKQIGVIDTWIQQKVNAIVSVVPEPQVFEKEAKKARAAGIVWVTYADRLKNQDGTLTWPHYTGGYLLGKAAAQYINANLGGKATVALLTFEQGAWARNRRMGMEAGLKKFAPGAKIVAKQDTLTAPQGLSIISTVLQAHPDLDVVLSVTDTGTEGAYQAFLNAHHPKNDPKVFIGGLDGTPKAFQLILSHTMYRASAALKLSDIGRAVIDLPARILATHKKQDSIVPYNLLSQSTLPATIKVYLADWGVK